MIDVVLDKHLGRNDTHLTKAFVDIDHGVDCYCSSFRNSLSQSYQEQPYTFTLKIIHRGDEIMFCKLNKNNNYQATIDVHLEKNRAVELICKSSGHIHLSGYTSGSQY